MSKIVDNIEKLAAQVAENALKTDTPLHDKTEALKLLTPYYTVLKKSKGRQDDESSGEPTMGDMQRRLRVIEQEPADDSGVETTTGGARG